MYCVNCGNLIEVNKCTKCGAVSKKKSKVIAIVLQLLLNLGIGRFYLGNKKIALLQFVTGVIIIFSTIFSYVVLGLMTAGMIDSVINSFATNLNLSEVLLVDIIYKILMATSFLTTVYKLYIVIDCVLIGCKKIDRYTKV